MSEPNPVTWATVKRKISELKEFDKNPRKITKDDFKLLVQSLQEDGYHGRIKINTDNVIIGGHARKKALLAAGYKKSDEIEVLMPDRLLESDYFDRVNIRDNLGYGNWDVDILGNNWDAEQLIAWGMNPLFIGESILEVEKEEPSIKETKPKTCPHCGELLN